MGRRAPVPGASEFRRSAVAAVDPGRRQRPWPSSHLLKVLGEQRQELFRLRQSCEISFQASNGRWNKPFVARLDFYHVEIVEAPDDLQISLNRRKHVNFKKFIPVYCVLYAFEVLLQII